MAKKRTKQQKIRAQYHYALPAQHSFSGIDNTAVAPNEAGSKLPAKAVDVVSLYSYDPKYVAIDLRKTVLFSVIILIIQAGLYMWLR